MSYKYYDNEKKKHYHELEGHPLIGTSTAMKVLPKVLTYWASGLACEKFGWTNPKNTPKEKRLDLAEQKRVEISTMSAEQFLALGDEAYKAHATSLKKSAEDGTDLHAELERFVKFCIGNGIPTPNTEDAKMFDNKIQVFIEWTAKNVKRFIWSEAHCYSKEFWTGGISDCGAELLTGDYIVIDFKSSKEAYFNHFVQGGLYTVQIEENGLFDSEGNQTLKLDKEIKGVCIVPFGAKEVVPFFNWEIEELKETAKLVVRLYKVLQKNNAI